MGAIQDRLINEVGAERVLADLGVDLSSMRSRREGTVRCPFHREKNGRALSVNLDRGLLKCHGKCDRAWDLVQAFSEVRGVPDGPELYRALDDAYFSPNGKPVPPKPAAPTSLAAPPAPLDRERDELYRSMFEGLQPGPGLAELFQARLFNDGHRRGIVVAVRDPFTGFFTDLKRRQTHPQPNPAYKSMSQVPWCLLCGKDARKGNATCEKDHPERVVRSKAGLMGLRALEAKPDHRPVLVAGEKDLLRAAGLLKYCIVPLSWSAGESSAPKGLGYLLEGQTLPVLYDADDKGQAAAPKAVECLAREGVRAVVARWEDAPEPRLDPSRGKKDLADWLDLGGSVETLAAWLLSLAPEPDRGAPLLSGAPPAEPPRAPPSASEGSQPEDPKPSAPLSMDDPYAGAQSFIAECRHEMSYPTLRRYQEDFFRWTGAKYRVVEREEVRKDLYDYCVDKGIPPTKNRVNTLEDALKVAALVPARPVNPPFWVERNEATPPDALFAFRNCLYDHRRGISYPHSPNFFGLNALPFDFAPNAPEPVEWLRFLTALWPDEPEVAALLQEIFGYCLGPDTRFQKMFVFFSEQMRCGKGTVGLVMSHIIGAENCAALPMANFGQHFGLETLIGKILNVTPDARFSYRQDQATITERLLSISAGDTLAVPRKNRTDWNGRLTTKLVVLTNAIPNLQDYSSALATRIVPVHFKNSWLGREDTELLDRIKPEASGILNWALEGRRRLYERGRFPMPPSSAALYARIEAKINPLREFLSEFCELGSGYEQVGKSVFDAYRAWCEQEDRHRTMVMSDFFENLRGAAPGVSIVKDSLGRRVIRGLQLRAGGFDDLYRSRPERSSFGD